MNRTVMHKRKKINRPGMMRPNQTIDDLEKNLYLKLQPPSRPKPPPFFEQAYCGKSSKLNIISDRASSVAGFRPYSNKINDDALSYFEYKDEQDQKLSKETHSQSQLIKQPINSNKNKLVLNKKIKQLAFYDEIDNKLVKNPVYKLTKGSLKSLDINRNRSASYGATRSVTSSKNRRLDLLRQKYMNQLTPTQKRILDAKTAISNNHKTGMVKDYCATIPNEQNQITIKVEDEAEDKADEAESALNQEIGTYLTEGELTEEVKLDELSSNRERKKSMDADRISSFSKNTSTRSKLDRILKELNEERHKRKELESMISELMSKTGAIQEKLQK